MSGAAVDVGRVACVGLGMLVGDVVVCGAAHAVVMKTRVKTRESFVFMILFYLNRIHIIFNSLPACILCQRSFTCLWIEQPDLDFVAR